MNAAYETMIVDDAWICASKDAKLRRLKCFKLIYN